MAAGSHRVVQAPRRGCRDRETGYSQEHCEQGMNPPPLFCGSSSPLTWAHFRSTKAAVKLHTLLDLHGNIPSFIHISDGKLHDVHALDMLLPEPGAIYVMDRGYVDFARLHA